MKNLSFWIAKGLLIVILSVITCTVSNAQTAQISAVISASLNAVATGSPLLEAFNTESQLENGLITSPVNFAVKTNRFWKLSTSITNIVGTPLAQSPTITAPLQPEHVSWGVVDGVNGTINNWNPFINLTTTSTAAVEAKTGTRGGSAEPGNTFTLRYKVTPGFTVEPGSYSVDVTYTVSPL